MIVGWQMVKAGYGIGFFDREIGAAEPTVVPVFDGSCIGTLPLWLTAHAELRTGARIRRVFDFLAERLR